MKKFLITVLILLAGLSLFSKTAPYASATTSLNIKSHSVPTTNKTWTVVATDKGLVTYNNQIAKEEKTISYPNDFNSNNSITLLTAKNLDNKELDDYILVVDYYSHNNTLDKSMDL